MRVGQALQTQALWAGDSKPTFVGKSNISSQRMAKEETHIGPFVSARIGTESSVDAMTTITRYTQHINNV